MNHDLCVSYFGEQREGLFLDLEENPACRCGVSVRVCVQIMHTVDTHRADAAGFEVVIMIGVANMSAPLAASTRAVNRH
ncbi:hypothetical protein [Novosphingobium panipatense]|uniref:hypothetical protein n=1 Tax=Novosphingobium panipatense TaxID=428991 RepID=UPI0024B83492|nr:hypothetical protein [Novosphingobium panipatense]